MSEETTYERIVRAYQEAGFSATQVAIAKSVGVIQPAVAHWKANNQISLKHIETIAKKTNTCIEWLLTGRGPMHPVSREAQELIDTIESLPKDQHKIALALLETLRKSRE